MKINQVEELTGITKKNIRFYEEQGLLKPMRNPNNGYREYSLEDVAMLQKIRVLRKLAIPIEDIRRMKGNDLSLEDCLIKRLHELERLKQNLVHMHLICQEMLEHRVAFQNINVEYYLDEMDSLEKGGTQFMDITKTDKRKKKIAPVIFTIVTIVLMLLMILAFWQANQTEPVPMGILIILIVMPILVIIGVIYACRERMNEIEGGELDEASKY